MTIKHIKLSFIFLFLLVILSACTASTDQAISEIEIDENSLNLVYQIDTFDIAEIDLIVHYENGTTKTVPLHENMIGTSDLQRFNDEGEHTILVEYQGHFTSFRLFLEVGLGEGIQRLNFYYLNDLHGALLRDDSDMGMAYIGNFLKDEKERYPQRTIILAGGDMLQGTILSNDTYGETTTEILDMAGFDAAVVGNHEFDWGLETITRYYQDNHDDVYRAQHPFLGANIVYKGTTTIPDGIEPYTIIERDGIRVGVIGTIGHGLASSIAALRVADYEFLDPVTIAETYAIMLRTEHDVDVVVLLTHDTGNDLNSAVAEFTGDSRIDAVFNGHSHRTNETFINGMPTIISGANGSHVGRIQMTLQDGEIIDTKIVNYRHSDDARLQTADPLIEAYINELYEGLSEYFIPLMTTDRYLSRRDLAEWMAQLMLDATGAQFAFQNTGGTRDDIGAFQEVSLATLLNIFPFDNQVITATVTGDDVINLQYHPYVTTFEGTIDTSATYMIATSDYIFYSDYNDLLGSEDITAAFNDMRDLALQELILQSDVYDYFDTNNPLLISDYLAQKAENNEN